MNANVVLSSDVMRALHLSEKLFSTDECLYVGAKVEVTIRNKGTFYGEVSGVGGAMFTLSKPIPVDCEEEELYADRKTLRFDIDDVIQVFSY